MYIPIGFIIFGSIVATGYVQYVDKSSINVIFNVFNKVMYLYTTIEYHVENIMKKCYLYKSTYLDPFVETFKQKQQVIYNSLIYIKNNSILDQDQVNDSGFDFIILKNGNNVFIDKIQNNILVRSNTECSSSVSFITFDVTFQTSENTNETFSLNMKKKDNYIQLGNKIDKYMIWYIIKDQFKRCMYEKPYMLQVIDGNVNMYTLSEKNIITILEDSVKTE